MHNFKMYLILTSVCLTIGYGCYKLFIENRVSPALSRVFILATVVFSLILPFHSYGIDMEFDFMENPRETEQKLMNASEPEALHSIPYTDQFVDTRPEPVKRYTSRVLVAYIYFVIMGIFLLRLAVNLVRVMYLRLNHQALKHDKNRVFITTRTSNSFSFFRWIFLNKKDKTESEIQNILLHENIHASQYHSADLLLIELVIAFMWFNPFIWFLRRSLQQIHEFLADEGALNTGLSKPMYKAHLLNQVAEERLIALSLGFNPTYRIGGHSLIKKRIEMMTKPKFSQKTNIRFLAIIPLSLLLFTGVACINGQKSDEEKKTVAAVAPTKMNVLYCGVNNPMSIAVSGYDADELEVKIENGRIEGDNGEYIIKPTRPGTLKVFVYANEELVSESHFRVKTVPNPVAKIAGRKGGSIRNIDLLKAGKVYIEMENFDFDLDFKLVEFTISSVIGGYALSYKSTDMEFTESQIELIEKLKPGQNLYIEDIKAQGPDGAIRELPTIKFTIEE